MEELILGVLVVLGLIGGCCYVYRAIWGECAYCGSKDIVPDDGLFFYCNDCKRKS